MGTVRTATLAARTPELSNVTVTAAQFGQVSAMLSDRQTFIVRNSQQIGVTTDYGATVTLNSKNFMSFGSAPDAIIELPSGELLVGVRQAAQAGQVWRSTGWNKVTATVTSWTQVLTASGPDVFFRQIWGMSGWSVAPAWSKHAGAIFLFEYGTTADIATTRNAAALRAYMSNDDGVTWRTIFNLGDQLPADTRLHVHGGCYDPWDGRVYITTGDGGAAQPGHSNVFYSDNAEDPTPTWTPIASLAGSTGDYQFTTVAAIESGIVLLADGKPMGTHILPRRGYRNFGPLQMGAMVQGFPSLMIGGALHRNGRNDPVPGAPILAVFLEASSGTNPAAPAVWSSNDGLSWREIYRRPAVATGGNPGFANIFGPTLDGKIVANFADGTNSGVFVADYIPTI